MTAFDYIDQSVNSESTPRGASSIANFADDDIICAGNAYGDTDACQGNNNLHTPHVLLYALRV